jgi:hypothetical protein
MAVRIEVELPSKRAPGPKGQVLMEKPMQWELG